VLTCSGSCSGSRGDEMASGVCSLVQTLAGAGAVQIGVRLSGADARVSVQTQRAAARGGWYMQSTGGDIQSV
jgi:hypothetical protein